MPFKRFVEPGRVIRIADGPDQGKLCVIVDVINQTRVLVDGPETGVSRGALRMNQLQLTKFCIKITHKSTTRAVRKAWKDEQISEKWKESRWCQRIENREKRAALTDFERFKLKIARRERSRKRTEIFNRLRRDWNVQNKIKDYARKIGYRDPEKVAKYKARKARQGKKV